jgi:photosystem II stability/assembly factor-like uncharacterized protein
LLLGLSWLAFTPAAKAQYHCSVRLPGAYGPIGNYFLAFATSGNYCTAAFLENDDTLNPHNAPAPVRLIFHHSTDGGQTWQRQDPGRWIPYDNYSYVQAIDQIDSVNEVAVGDSSLILRTSNGGKTWQRQSLPLYSSQLFNVSFANPNEGVIIGYDDSIGYNIIYTTMDGGVHWVVARMHDDVGQAHAYGNGKFRFFRDYYGTIYTTLDNFQTIDSTTPIFDSMEIVTVINGQDKLLNKCVFGSGDSIIAYGENLIADTITHTGNGGHPLIWRTTDAGISWNEVLDSTPLENVTCMTDINRDTVLAGISGGHEEILFSTNHGATWNVDSLAIDTSIAVFSCYGIGLNPNGSIVGAFGPVFSLLIFGQWGTAGVSVPGPLTPRSNIYPNPASESVNITSIDPGSTIHLLDVLGREVLHGTVPPNDLLTLDVSHLAKGIYVALIGDNMIPIGKLLVNR